MTPYQHIKLFVQATGAVAFFIAFIWLVGIAAGRIC